MTVSQLSIFVENKAGKLVEITEVLGRAGIDIRAMSIADTQDFGILRLIVSDAEKAKKSSDRKRKHRQHNKGYRSCGGRQTRSADGSYKTAFRQRRKY